MRFNPKCRKYVICTLAHWDTRMLIKPPHILSPHYFKRLSENRIIWHTALHLVLSLDFDRAAWAMCLPSSPSLSIAGLLDRLNQEKEAFSQQCQPFHMYLSKYSGKKIIKSSQLIFSSNIAALAFLS